MQTNFFGPELFPYNLYITEPLKVEPLYSVLQTITRAFLIDSHNAQMHL